MNNKQFYILTSIVVVGFAIQYQKTKRIKNHLVKFVDYYFEWEDYYYQQEVDEDFQTIIENL